MKTVDVLNAYIEEGEAEDEEEQYSKASSGMTLQVPGIRTTPDIKITSDSPEDKEDTQKPGHGHGHGHSHFPVVDDSTVTTLEITGDAHGHSHHVSWTATLVGGATTSFPFPYPNLLLFFHHLLARSVG